MKTHLAFLAVLFEFTYCRDFYVGMFKKNDFLVAQDTVYKEKNSFGYAIARYGRVFHCPITYFRVSDRLGTGNFPRVSITRGGLQKKYITLRLTSAYDTPVAVNIYVGCKNNFSTTTTTTTTSTSTTAEPTEENKETTESLNKKTEVEGVESTTTIETTASV